MRAKRVFRNEITYTTAGRDGMRHEQRTNLDRPYILTQRGAQALIRAEQPTAVVVNVSPIVYA